MLRRTTAVLLGFLTACGGGESTNPPPPPPPPPGSSGPASLAIQAGDGQQAEPGATLPVRPAVLVRNGSGQPVSGVAVAFAVDSGGGSLTSATATTGGNGIATAGDWRLGQSEGRNVLLVSVSGVAPVRIGARAALAATIVATQTLPASGGTLVITRPGTPLDGFSFTLPAGAVSAPLELTVGYRSSGGLPLPDGIPALSPMVTIASDGPAVAAQSFTMRIPVTIPAGVEPVAVVYDTVKGVLGVYPVVDYDGSGVTITSRILDAAQMVPSPTAALRAAPGSHPARIGSGAAAVAVIILGPVDPRDITTNWLVGRDNWEFPDTATAYGINTEIGQVLSAWLWPAHQLYGQTDLATGVGMSNSSGIMLAAGLTKEFVNWDGGRLLSYAEQHPQNPKYHAGQKAALKLLLRAKNGPVPLLLRDANGFLKALLVFGWNEPGKYFRVADPCTPLVEQKLRFATTQGQLMVPYSDACAPAYEFLDPAIIPYVANPMDVVPSQVAEALDPNATEEYALDWPKWAIRSWDPILLTPGKNQIDTVFLITDTTRLWTASKHTWAEPTSLPLPAGTGLQTQTVYYYGADNAWHPYAPTSGGGLFLDYSSMITTTHPWLDVQIGVNAKRFEDGSGTRVTWLGYRELAMIKLSCAVRPVRGAPGIPVTISAVSLGGPALPLTGTYEWDFGDGTPKTRVTGSLSVTHTYQTRGDYDVELTIFHANGKEIGGTESSALVANLLSIDQSPKWTLEPGDQVTFTASYTGPALSNPEYRWDLGNGSTPKGPPTAQTSYGLPPGLTSKSYPVKLELWDGTTRIATAGVFPVVEVDPPEAWRIVTFTRTFTGVPNFGVPQIELNAVAAQDVYLRQVETAPGDGFFFLPKAGAEPGLWFEVVAPGTGDQVTYYQTGALLLMVARSPSIPDFDSFYKNLGDYVSGTINGAAHFGITYVPGVAAAGFLNTVSAVKNGDSLSGTVTFALRAYGVKRTFSFTATRSY